MLKGHPPRPWNGNENCQDHGASPCIEQRRRKLSSGGWILGKDNFLRSGKAGVKFGFSRQRGECQSGHVATACAGAPDLSHEGGSSSTGQGKNCGGIFPCERGRERILQRAAQDWCRGVRLREAASAFAATKITYKINMIPADKISLARWKCMNFNANVDYVHLVSSLRKLSLFNIRHVAAPFVRSRGVIRSPHRRLGRWPLLAARGGPVMMDDRGGCNYLLLCCTPQAWGQSRPRGARRRKGAALVCLRRRPHVYYPAECSVKIFRTLMLSLENFWGSLKGGSRGLSSNMCNRSLLCCDWSSCTLEC